MAKNFHPSEDSLLTKLRTQTPPVPYNDLVHQINALPDSSGTRTVKSLHTRWFKIKSKITNDEIPESGGKGCDKIKSGRKKSGNITKATNNKNHPAVPSKGFMMDPYRQNSTEQEPGEEDEGQWVLEEEMEWVDGEEKLREGETEEEERKRRWEKAERMLQFVPHRKHWVWKPLKK